MNVRYGMGALVCSALAASTMAQVGLTGSVMVPSSSLNDQTTVAPLVLNVSDEFGNARLHLDYGEVRLFAGVAHSVDFNLGGGVSGTYSDLATIDAPGLAGTPGTAIAHVFFEGALSGSGSTWQSGFSTSVYVNSIGEHRFSGDSSAFGPTGDPLPFTVDVFFSFTYGMAFGITVLQSVNVSTNQGAAFADFESTTRWQGISDLRDGDGNLVSNATLDSASGADYLNPVPEPATLVTLALAAVLALRRRSIGREV